VQTIVINKIDNVAVSLMSLLKGSEISAGNNKIVLKNNIETGHKIALKNFNVGDNIIKYGSPIGHATQAIKLGEHIHTHNCTTNLKGLDSYTYLPVSPHLYPVQLDSTKTFKGYRRANGEVGIRNELWIIPLVGCVNGIANKAISNFMSKVTPSKQVDAVKVLSHPLGCSQLGDDHQNTKVILQNLVQHPNAGGVIVLGLGCENNQMADFKANLTNYNTQRTRFLVAQEVGDEITDINSLLSQLYALMQNDKRQEIPIGELKIGLKCGGSDGLSGITANPLIGLFSDYLIGLGGSTVLCEVPEMFGAEEPLMARSATKEIFDKNVAMINNFKQYFIDSKQQVYENPSPGNKAGGITTLEDKSLGCTQKSGSATVVDVLNYTQRLTKSGLNLLSTPGNDLVSSSAMAATGCAMVLFSTGRGNPYGTVVPTVKVASNTALAQKKPHWIDFDAGVITQKGGVELALPDFIKKIITIAEGEQTKNEINGHSELAIFKTGVTL
jgi:altronate hydrolase